MRISYYMFRASVTDFNLAWKEGRPPSYREVRLKRHIKFDGAAFLERKPVPQPPWLAFVLDHCYIDDADQLGTQGVSLVVFLRAKGRVFAVTFGRGYTALSRKRLEPDFGLRIALNSLKGDNLRSLQSRNVDSNTVQKLFVASRASNLGTFDVDLYQELLSKLEGVPESEKFGTRVMGADALYLNSDVAFPQLADKCGELLSVYQSRRYRKSFPMVDAIRPERDESLVATLEDIFRAELLTSHRESVSMAVPDISRYGEIEGYRASLGRWSHQGSELDANAILTSFVEGVAAGGDPCQIQLDAIDSTGVIIDSFSLLRCSVFETTLRGQTYVLSLGTWFRIAADYVDRVNLEFSRIPEVRSHKLLPVCHETGKDAEGLYNARIAKLMGYALLDKKLASIPGETTIEVCDLFTSQKQFIHVKRGTSGGKLSHLLAQGSVSARLIQQYEEYRKQFRAKLPAKQRGLVPVAGVNTADYTVIYAIIEPPTRTLKNLSFFTKVNLVHHVSLIRSMGYRVAICHVDQN